MRIAVIGTGISGLSSAWMLREKHDIWLYEKDHRPGGHSHTVTIDYDGTRISADTGFMVYNERTYPNLVRMFAALGIATQPSDMSFAASIDNGRIEYAGTNFSTLFAQKRNIASPRYLRMLADIRRFNRLGADFLCREPADSPTLGEFLDRIKVRRAFKHHYLLPMAGAIWSAPIGSIEQFPAASFLRFFANHGLLTINGHPTWRTVKGGSGMYVDKICRLLGDRLLLQCPVIDVRRDTDGVWVTDGRGGRRLFDAAVMATHSDQALSILGDADALEQQILGSIRYQPNVAVLHRDPALMPKRRKVWSSWNYHASTDDSPQMGVSLTYWLNNLQGVASRHPLFVSINPRPMPDQNLTFKTISYAHPLFDQSAIDGQRAMASIQNRGGVWYAGAWLGHGFHEDGLRSAIEVVRALGVKPPWESESNQPASSDDVSADMPDRAVAGARI